MNQLLVVEDSPTQAELLRETLEEAGFAAIVAGSAEEALGKLDENRVDLVISDIVMPGISGRELAEHVRRTRPDIRILYMSGYAYYPGSNTAFPHPGDAYIQKPFAPAALAAKVREILDGGPSAAN